MSHLCDHHVNRAACPLCFHSRPKTVAAPVVKKGPPTSAYEQMNVAVLSQVKARALANAPAPEVVAMGEAEPMAGGQAAPVVPVVGYIAPAMARPKPSAEQQRPGAVPVPKTIEPYSSRTKNPGTYVDGIWHPPAHRSVIDSLPSHPFPNGVSKR